MSSPSCRSSSSAGPISAPLYGTTAEVVGTSVSAVLDGPDVGRFRLRWERLVCLNVRCSCVWRKPGGGRGAPEPRGEGAVLSRRRLVRRRCGRYARRRSKVKWSPHRTFQFYTATSCAASRTLDERTLVARFRFRARRGLLTLASRRCLPRCSPADLLLRADRRRAALTLRGVPNVRRPLVFRSASRFGQSTGLPTVHVAQVTVISRRISMQYGFRDKTEARVFVGRTISRISNACV